MSDEATIEGRRLKREASLAAKDDDTYIKEAEDRQIFGNYLAITHIIALNCPFVFLSDDEAYDNILRWQKRWENKSSGATGEVLLKIAGLLDLESEKILNPGKNIDLRAILKEKAMTITQNGKLAKFIEKNIIEIDNYEQGRGEEIRIAVGFKDNKTEMRSENIQKALEKRIEKAKK